jgi:hypothetical protein
LKYEGIYTSKSGEQRMISLEDGRLLLYPPRGLKVELIPVDKDRFHPENTLATLHFSRDKKGGVDSFTLYSTESPVPWTRVNKNVPKPKAIKVSPREFDQFVGRYQAGQGYFTIIREGDKLYGKAPGENQVKQEILPIEKYLFFARNIDAQIRFNMNQNGKVMSLTIIQNGEKTATKVD